MLSTRIQLTKNEAHLQIWLALIRQRLAQAFVVGHLHKIGMAETISPPLQSANGIYALQALLVLRHAIVTDRIFINTANNTVDRCPTGDTPGTNIAPIVPTTQEHVG